MAGFFYAQYLMTKASFLSANTMVKYRNYIFFVSFNSFLVSVWQRFWSLTAHTKRSQTKSYATIRERHSEITKTKA